MTKASPWYRKRSWQWGDYNRPAYTIWRTEVDPADEPNWHQVAHMATEQSADMWLTEAIKRHPKAIIVT